LNTTATFASGENSTVSRKINDDDDDDDEDDVDDDSNTFLS
jgi:hypothetical protein